MKFTEIVKANFPQKAIRVRVGNDETYLGVNCKGLANMTEAQIRWLDNHAPIHVYYHFGKAEVEIVYKANKTHHRIVWG